jgi:hypothetical protein
MSQTIDVRAHAEMIPLEATGLVGGEHIILVLPGRDDLSIRIKVVGQNPFAVLGLSPGDRVMVTLGMVKIGLVDLPEELPGLGKAKLIKGIN